jgi:hypothetical protein
MRVKVFCLTDALVNNNCPNLLKDLFFGQCKFAGWSLEMLRLIGKGSKEATASLKQNIKYWVRKTQLPPCGMVSTIAPIKMWQFN